MIALHCRKNPASGRMEPELTVKVGDLVKYLQTGDLHLVVATEGENFYLDGWGDFKFGLLTEIEVINESR